MCVCVCAHKRVYTRSKHVSRCETWVTGDCRGVKFNAERVLYGCMEDDTEMVVKG